MTEVADQGRPSGKGSFARRTMKALLVAGSSLAVTLVLVELVLRGFGLVPVAGGFTVSERDFERLPGIWEPGQNDIVTDNIELPYRFTSNALGYRGMAFEREKPAGQFRILYVGDSFTFGAHVDDEHTLPAQLHDLLADVCSNTLVINAGLGGSTLTEHRGIIERSLAVAPDLVILQFSENDVADLRGQSMWDQLRENREAKSRFPVNIVYGLTRRTALWGLVLRVRAIARIRAAADEPPRAPTQVESGSGRYAGLREEYTTHLEDIASLLEAEGIPLVFVAYPVHLTLYGIEDDEQMNWVTSLAATVTGTVIDLRESLAESGLPEEELFLLPHDGHPSPRGYEVASVQVADRLAVEGLLPPACAAPAG